MMAAFRNRKLQQELLVYGYVREHCSTSKMPKELIQLCFLMYFIIIDNWTKANCFDLLKECRIAHTYYNPHSGGWKSIFGSLRVNKGDIQTWKLKRSQHNEN